MSNWLLKATEDWLEPIYDTLHGLLCLRSNLHADETTIQVLREPGKTAQSNNRAERSIKPFVIGRKNFLFANTPRGAKASAIIFNLIETAKENGLNPFAYLTYIFKNAPNWDIRNNPDMLQLLMPDCVPASLKSPNLNKQDV